MRAELRGEGAGGRLDLAEVEPAVGGGRGGGADHRGAHPAELGRAGGDPEALREHAPLFGGAEGAGLGAGPVPDGGDAGGHGGLGQGQSERAESDDGEICGHGVDRPSQ